jgi:hypothetical protein
MISVQIFGSDCGIFCYTHFSRVFQIESVRIVIPTVAVDPSCIMAAPYPDVTIRPRS